MSLADQTLARIRAVHDDLVARVPTLTDEQLVAPSGATQWHVAQVLSHLGSQSEIALAALEPGLRGEEVPGQEFNEAVWARWNALDDRHKAEGFVETSTRLVEALEAVPDRDNQKMTFAFLPFPVPFAAALGMRLNEYALHGWDVLVGLDGTATVDAETAAVMTEHLAGGMDFMLGFLGKPDELPEPAVVQVADLRIVIAETVTLDPTATLTATVVAPLEAGYRLLNGRLREEVPVTGDVTLEQLRRVFQGY